MRLRRRRKPGPAIDLRHTFPLRYVGPTTKWGLVHDSLCRDVGHGHSGMRLIVTTDGGRWQVPPVQLERA